jgi:hypothetical protein
MNRECPLAVVASGPSVARSSDSPAGITSCLGIHSRSASTSTFPGQRSLVVPLSDWQWLQLSPCHDTYVARLRWSRRVLDRTSDLFRIRELRRSRMLSYLGNELRRVVRVRPLVSVAVSGDRYSVCHSERQRSCAAVRLAMSNGPRDRRRRRPAEVLYQAGHVDRHHGVAVRDHRPGPGAALVKSRLRPGGPR